MSLPPVTPAIELKSLSKNYNQSNGRTITAVHNLDLKVKPGQIFGLLGPNGAGKTTTIKMICSLIRPSTGQIFLNGLDVSRQKKAAMTQIGAVLEGARNIYWRLSAMQNLIYFGRLKGQTHRLKERAEQLLHDLDLWERRDDQVRFFSRGMQQKVALAAALMSDPSILLLDEPTLGLDVQAAQTIREMVKQLAEEEGKTIILTTHQLDIAQEVCHQIGIMRQGQMIANQPIRELLALFRQEYYEIKIDGVLTNLPADLKDVLTFSQADEVQVLTGPLSNDQLHFLLAQIKEKGLTLLSVNQVEPDLEEVFIKLLEAA